MTTAETYFGVTKGSINRISQSAGDSIIFNIMKSHGKACVNLIYCGSLLIQPKFSLSVKRLRLGSYQMKSY